MPYYTNKNYPDFQQRSGPEQSAQELRIKNGFDAAETDINTNATQIQLVKGGGGAPVTDLIWLYWAARTARNPGHTHDSTSLLELPTHSHLYTDIMSPPWALQTDFDDLAGAGWTSGGGRDVMSHHSSITAINSTITTMKGVGWSPTQTLVEIFRLMQSRAVVSPGHMHTASDISGVWGLYVPMSLFSALAGAGWVNPTENMHTLWGDVYGGHALGHTHLEAEITDLQTYALLSQLNALKGVGYTSETVRGNYDLIIATRGVGWIAQWTNTWLASQVNALYADTSAINTTLATIQTSLTNAKGPGYTNTTTFLQNITGVTIVYPTSNGTPANTYNLNFIHKDTGPTTYHRLRWANGTIKDLDSGNGTYTVYDVSGSTYINCDVTIVDLPTSDQTDVVTVYSENIHDLYLKYYATSTGSGTMSNHIQVTHGDALIGTPVVAAGNPGVDRSVDFTGIEANIGGVKAPTGSGTLDSTETLDAPAAGMHRIDVLSINASGSAVVTKGTETAEATGIVNFPTLPAYNVAFQYVYVPNPSTRAWIKDTDLLGTKLVMDWMTRWNKLKDAVDYHGDSVDQEYGYSIEIPRNISGISLSVNRLFVVEQPTNNANVTLEQLDNEDYHVRHYNTSPPDSYSLEWDSTAQELTWGGGTPVYFDVQSFPPGPVSQTSILLDSSGTTGIKATMTQPMLGDQTDTSLEVGSRATPGVGRYAIEWDGFARRMRFDGGSWTSITDNGHYYLASKASSGTKYVHIHVMAYDALPDDTYITDYVRVFWNGLTELDLKIEECIKLHAAPHPVVTMGSMLDRQLYGFYFGNNLRSLLHDSTTEDLRTSAKSFTIDQVALGEFFNATDNTTAVGLMVTPGRIALGADSSKYLEMDTTTSNYLMNTDMVLAEGGTIRMRPTAAPDHHPLDWGTLRTSGLRFVAHDSSGTVGSWSDITRWTPHFLHGKKFVSALTSGLDMMSFMTTYVLPRDFYEFVGTGPHASAPAIITTLSTDTTRPLETSLELWVHKARNWTPVATRSNMRSGEAGKRRRYTMPQLSLSAGGFQRGDRLALVYNIYSRDSSSAFLWDSELRYRITPT